MTKRGSADYTPPIHSPSNRRSPSLSSPRAPQHPAPGPGSLPLTPPSSPGPHRATNTSTDTTTSNQSHEEYLDSLIPPTNEEFQRLAKLQAEREKERKNRAQELRRRSMAIAQKNMEARQDFL